MSKADGVGLPGVPGAIQSRLGQLEQLDGAAQEQLIADVKDLLPAAKQTVRDWLLARPDDAGIPFLLALDGNPGFLAVRESEWRSVFAEVAGDGMVAETATLGPGARVVYDWLVTFEKLEKIDAPDADPVYRVTVTNNGKCELTEDFASEDAARARFLESKNKFLGHP